jgi:ketosteroid isomerase-like protein
MNTFQIGSKLVDFCSQGKDLEAIETLDSANIVSVEAVANPNFAQRIEGIEAVRGKAQWWFQNHDIHGAQVTGPFPHGDRFIVFFKYDITPKDGPMKGQRVQMDEAALYTVKDGKIVKEEFFYQMGS